jgi:hypothetical protein
MKMLVPCPPMLDSANVRLRHSVVFRYRAQRPSVGADRTDLRNTQFGSSLVPRLLSMRAPVAVAWTVAQIIISSLKRQAARAMSHVGKEVFKQPPSFANLNAASTVVVIARAIAVIATLPHSHPATVNAATSTAKSVTVLSRTFECCLSLEAPTRTCAVVVQICALNSGFDSAVATVAPVMASAAFITMRDSKNDQSTKTVSSDIDKSGHGDLSERLPRQVTVARA